MEDLQAQLEELRQQNQLLQRQLQEAQQASRDQQHPPTHQQANHPTFTPLDQDVAYVPLKLPPFWPDQPELWFAQVEAQFRLANITHEATKFAHIISQLDCRHAQEVRDIILSPPAANPYTRLKHELITRLSPSEHQRMQQLLVEQQGDRTPSRFLRQLQQLAGTSTMDIFIRHLWLQRLPQQVQVILQAHATTLPLDQLAQLADRIIEVAPITPPAVHATSAFPRVDPQLARLLDSVSSKIATLEAELQLLTSHPPPHHRHNHDDQAGYVKPRTFFNSHGSSCWYHHTFGTFAKKCSSPCTFNTIKYHQQPQTAAITRRPSPQLAVQTNDQNSTLYINKRRANINQSTTTSTPASPLKTAARAGAQPPQINYITTPSSLHHPST